MKLIVLILAVLLALLPESLAVGYGARGTHVENLQEKLRHCGFTLAKDGIFGPRTRSAVIAFQKTHKLSPTGVWDEITDRLAERESFRARCFLWRAACLKNLFAAKQPEPEQKVQNATRTRLPQGAKVTKASVFGLTVKGKWDKKDNGVGSPYLSDNIKRGIITRNAHLRGVALPAAEISKVFGVPMPPKRSHYASKKAWAKACRQTWEAWEVVRRARVEILCPHTGKCLSKEPAKIVDLGPGYGPQMNGVGIDFTYKLNREIGGDGMTLVAYKILKPSFAKLASNDMKPEDKKQTAPVGQNMLAQR